MYRNVNAGHVGCSLSAAEILTVVKFSWFQPGDELILSKGHAAAALYSVLAEYGDIHDTDCATFYQEGTLYAAHPPPGKIPGIRFATGSLGHGLSLGSGLALANKLDDDNARIYVVCSDGEMNEGSTWEAVLFAGHHKFANLVCIVDRNQIQGFGRTEDVISLGDLGAKFRQFGWDAVEVPGHDVDALSELYTSEICRSRNKPLAIICNTIKGYGYCELENTVACHYLPMTEEQYSKMVPPPGANGV